MPELPQPFLYDLLQIRLSNVDDVHHAIRTAEPRRVGRGPGGIARRLPQRVGCWKAPVEERPVEQPELPELVGDVLAGVRNRAVRAAEDLVRLVHAGELLPALELH